MPSDLELLGRLLLAVVLGGVVGAERELADQPAGLRTHVLLTLGACLFTMISAYGFGAGSDPSRLAAQIVTGIGFLGGGAILRHGLTVRGLTTAASIWASAALGVTLGIGRYLLAVGATALMLATLVLLKTVRNLLRRYAASLEEVELEVDPDFHVETVVDLMLEHGVRVRGMEREQVGRNARIRMLLRFPARSQPEQVIERIGDLDGVHNVNREG